MLEIRFKKEICVNSKHKSTFSLDEFHVTNRGQRSSFSCGLSLWMFYIGRYHNTQRSTDPTNYIIE